MTSIRTTAKLVLTPATTAEAHPALIRHACSWCGREQFGDGAWVVPETKSHPELVSHTICPTCYDEAIPRALKELEDM